MLETSDIETFDATAVNSARVRQPLYAPRKKIFPQKVEGRFRRFKWIVMLITLGIYYLTPWLRWNRGPYAPDQGVLVDLANRRFYFFPIEIWPQELYFVAGLLIMAGFGLFLLTSTIGRAWCGYTCPQTVWVDLFLAVERAVEGDRNARIKFDGAPWSASKLIKKITKHAIWVVIAVATGGAWIFYFADAPTLLHDLVTGHAAPVAYITIAILTGTTYIFGGLMREQVCTYMCPWARRRPARRIPAGRSSRRTATPRRRPPKGRRWATASTAMPVSRSAPWASISATDSNSNASPARCASMRATTSWTRSASRRG